MTKGDQPGSTLPRRELARVLRDTREGTGFTLEHTAQLMAMGKTSLGRIEKGQKDKSAREISKHSASCTEAS